MTKLEAIAFFMDMDECTYGGSEPIQMAIEALKQDSILDQIRAEIAMYEADCRLSGDEEQCKQCTDNVFGSIYRIIDKYKAEKESE